MSVMPHLPRRLFAAATLCLASSAGAVDPSFWVHDAPADWADATLEGVTVTSYGEIVPAGTVAVAEGGSVQIVHGLASAGTVVAVVGPEPKLLRLTDDNRAEEAFFTGLDADALLSIGPAGDGGVLLGTAGEPARLVRVTLPEPGESAEVAADVALPDARYAWAIAGLPDGSALAGTGPNAQLFRVADGAAEAVFTADGERHVQAVAVGADGAVYVGTSPGGVVWQLDPANGFAARVLLDAGEPEVTALLVDGEQLWVLTAGEGEGIEPTGDATRGTPFEGEARTFDDDVLPDIELPDVADDEPDSIPLQEDDAIEEFEREDVEAEPGVARAGRLSSGASGFGDGSGSALYRIDLSEARRGTVTGVLRDAGLLFDLAKVGDALYVAAGSSEEGPARLIRVNSATGETAVTPVPAGGQITTLLADGDTLRLGLSNPGGLATLEAAGEGTLTSGVLDAGSVARFGVVRLVGRQPEGAVVRLSARSGMTADADAAAGWSEWTEDVDARRFNEASVPPGRYFQYRLTLAPGADGAVPAVERVTVSYQTPNRPPTITNVVVEGEATGLSPAEVADVAMASGQSVGSVRSVTWDAADPDGDGLTFEVRIRRGRSGPFETVASDLSEPAWAWDARATGQGLYEVQIVASDARANPGDSGAEASRVTPPFRIDLTPPQIGTFATADGAATFRVLDASGAVARVEYLAGTDASDPSAWRRLFPEDGIADEPGEAFSVPLAGLDLAVLRVRAVDDGGNLAYTSFPLPPADE